MFGNDCILSSFFSFILTSNKIVIGMYVCMPWYMGMYVRMPWYMGMYVCMRLWKIYRERKETVSLVGESVSGGTIRVRE
jgi:hypothetical protein